MKISVLIPTYNAGQQWALTIESINQQKLSIFKKIIIDSGSTDGTTELARKHGFETTIINQNEFNHGATRQALLELASGSDLVIFMTQDAILAKEDAFDKLIKAFKDPAVALAYGRQLPHKNAILLEKHARLFNYPALSYVRQFKDKERYGFKTIFCSNSFAAYRVDALTAAGGFPLDSIMGEDTIVAAQLLRMQRKVAYVAEALVYHSHHYTFQQEFKRFFDTRVFHEQHPWLFELYGKPTSEGLKYIRSEVNFAIKHNPFLLVKILSSVTGKWLGYQAGKYYYIMPRKLLLMCSMHSFYWQNRKV